MADEENGSDDSGNQMLGVGIALGMVFGTSFGVVFDNLALGVAFGIAGGTVLGLLWPSGKKAVPSEDQSDC